MRRPNPMRRSSLAIIFLIVVANFTVFALLNRPVDPPAWEGKIAGVSFAPYRAGQGPLDKIYPTEAEIREDLRHVSPHTGSVRSTTATPRRWR